MFKRCKDLMMLIYGSSPYIKFEPLSDIMHVHVADETKKVELPHGTKFVILSYSGFPVNLSFSLDGKIFFPLPGDIYHAVVTYVLDVPTGVLYVRSEFVENDVWILPVG